MDNLNQGMDNLNLDMVSLNLHMVSLNLRLVMDNLNQGMGNNHHHKLAMVSSHKDLHIASPLQHKAMVNSLLQHKAMVNSLLHNKVMGSRHHQLDLLLNQLVLLNHRQPLHNHQLNQHHLLPRLVS